MLDNLDLIGISLITCDSREVVPGSIFVAVKGAHHDGHDFIDEALKSGANYIVCRHDTPGEDKRLIKTDNPRLALSHLAIRFYKEQPANIVAVTGTNGKSSIVTFTQQIWQALGHKAQSLGTLTGNLTSPDPVTMHKTLAHAAKNGVTHLALEASSHGLDQHRIDAVTIKAAGFTNLSHDHLDYHADMDEYLTAKSRLFSECLAEDGIAVLNADAPEYETLKKQSRGQVISYGYKGEHLKILKTEPLPTGTQAELKIFGHTYNITIPLIGAFQLSNILCALGLSFLTAAPDKSLIDASIEAIKTIKPAKGRLDPVPGHPKNAQIYIDYAHTPDALETILKTLRPHTKGRLHCVFGCGGDRDKAKRPAMGRIAFDHCESVIITDDNPRSEKPVDIRNEILSGLPQIKHNKTVLEIGDRAAAIDQSIQTLDHNDTLVIAGKGHETGQILESGIVEFDDYKEAEKAIKKLLEGSS